MAFDSANGVFTNGNGLRSPKSGSAQRSSEESSSRDCVHRRCTGRRPTSRWAAPGQRRPAGNTASSLVAPSSRFWRSVELRHPGLPENTMWELSGDQTGALSSPASRREAISCAARDVQNPDVPIFRVCRCRRRSTAMRRSSGDIARLSYLAGSPTVLSSRPARSIQVRRVVGSPDAATSVEQHARIGR